MLVLLAVGVQSVGDGGPAAVPCAPDDARRLYSTLARVCGDVFDHARSVVAIDPTDTEFLALITGTATALRPDDQLVVYFSGHADEREGMTRLLLANASVPGRGRLHVDMLAAPLVDASARAVIILDCCNAGNALTVADTRDGLLPRRISIVVSSAPFTRSYFGPEGSAFTLALCRALDELAESGAPLTLSALADKVEADPDFARRVHVNYCSGHAEDSIMYDRPTTLVPADAVSRFLETAGTAGVRMSEALWYALPDMPLPFQLEVLSATCRSATTSEASWLVRRAIGSVLGGLPEHSRTRRELMGELLEQGRNWMDATVGAVAARNDVAGDAELLEMLLAVLRRSDVMDVTWLAHLYTADAAPERALSLALESALTESEWGVLDIYRRHAHRWGDDRSLLLSRLRSHVPPEHLGAVRTHLLLNGAPHDGLDDVAYPEEIVRSQVARQLYQMQGRGKIQQVRAKWLLSCLYGSWRDQVGQSALDAVMELPASRQEAEAAMLADLPAVELRMALAAEAACSPRDDDPAVLAVRRWSARDPHPWVRRESVRGDSECAWLLDPVPDRRVYPGAFDLAINAATFGHDLTGYLVALDLPASESEALSIYVPAPYNATGLC